MNDISRHKIMANLFFNSMVDEIKDMADKIKTCPESEKLDRQLELAELVAYYNDKGFLNALRVHWPAINEFLDLLLELRENNKKAEELQYIREINNGSGGVIK